MTLICGDSIIELEKLSDESINITIMDPPYGISYKSNRSPKENHITKRGVVCDDYDTALQQLEDVCEILNRKMVKDSHIYIFASWKTYCEFKQIIEKFFRIKSLIVWDKRNGGSGDLRYSWGERHEFIFYAMKGKKELTHRLDNVLSISKVHSSKLIHPTQKPVKLIYELLHASVKDGDVVCDPFMGSGSTIRAVKRFKGLKYIGIEIDKEMFEIAKGNIKKEQSSGMAKWGVI